MAGRNYVPGGYSVDEDDYDEDDDDLYFGDDAPKPPKVTLWQVLNQDNPDKPEIFIDWDEALKEKKVRQVIWEKDDDKGSFNPENHVLLDNLRIGALNGRLDSIKEAVEMGVPIDEPLKCDWTLLMWASYHGQPDIVKYCLGRKADPTFSVKFGAEPVTATWRPSKWSVTLSLFAMRSQIGGTVNMYAGR